MRSSQVDKSNKATKRMKIWLPRDGGERSFLIFIKIQLQIGSEFEKSGERCSHVILLLINPAWNWQKINQIKLPPCMTWHLMFQLQWLKELNTAMQFLSITWVGVWTHWLLDLDLIWHFCPFAFNCVHFSHFYLILSTSVYMYQWHYLVFIPIQKISCHDFSLKRVRLTTQANPKLDLSSNCQIVSPNFLGILFREFRPFSLFKFLGKIFPFRKQIDVAFHISNFQYVLNFWQQSNLED